MASVVSPLCGSVIPPQEKLVGVGLRLGPDSHTNTTTNPIWSFLKMWNSPNYKGEE